MRAATITTMTSGVVHVGTLVEPMIMYGFVWKVRMDSHDRRRKTHKLAAMACQRCISERWIGAVL
jgi:hypothetical protein